MWWEERQGRMHLVLEMGYKGAEIVWMDRRELTQGLGPWWLNGESGSLSAAAVWPIANKMLWSDTRKCPTSNFPCLPFTSLTLAFGEDACMHPSIHPFFPLFTYSSIEETFITLLPWVRHLSSAGNTTKVLKEEWRRKTSKQTVINHRDED